MRKTLLLSLLLWCAGVQAQPAADAFAGKPDCLVERSGQSGEATAVWSGGCKDGYAEGLGTLQWFHAGKEGDRYEGGWQGSGNHAGGPEGSGTKVFVLGGSYRGQWHHGKPDGDGEILYPNGQVLKGRFNGSFLLTGKEAAPSSAQQYQVKHAEPPVGSHLAEVAATGHFVPPEKSYAALTPDQQRLVKHAYPLLQEDDVPPYPALGHGELSRNLSNLIRQMDRLGEVLAIVSIDEQGVPQSVALLKMPSSQVGNLVASMLMLAKYTPGRCGGQPCAMAVPFTFDLSYTK